jgi:hypothetical protein
MLSNSTKDFLFRISLSFFKLHYFICCIVILGISAFDSHIYASKNLNYSHIYLINVS